MSTIASKLAGNLGPPHLGIVLTTLITGLAGRTWAGKVRLLFSLRITSDLSFQNCIYSRSVPTKSGIGKFLLDAGMYYC